MSQEVKRRKELGYLFNKKGIVREAEELFDNIFNLRQFLSGRTHWVGGADTKVAEKFPLANFNCSFIEITKWNDLAELFYLLLVGTGVGLDRKSTRLNSSHVRISYAVFCLKKKNMMYSALRITFMICWILYDNLDFHLLLSLLLPSLLIIIILSTIK